MLQNFFLVGLGGALGSMLRYSVSLLMAHYAVASYAATFCVNGIGSFLITFFAAICCKEGPLLLFCTVGFCGGFTTYSTFSSQSLQMLQSGKYTTAFTYIGATLLLCLLCSWLGMLLGGRLK